MNLLDRWIQSFTSQFPHNYYLGSPSYIHGLLAVILVAFICGAVGSLVVGNRMAFFSDALAHCAFAGVGLGLLIALATGGGPREMDLWIPTIMVGFGILIGLGIAYVRDKTALASDTVIGVFFAGAIGFGAVMLKAATARVYYSPENFLFGDIVFVTGQEIIILFILALVTIFFLIWLSNRLVFASFNASLALSRQIPVRLCNYLFIVLLAVIVNVCLKAVGALLINALLIVPAATAANLCRNMRQLFWWSIVICLFSGVFGQWLSTEVSTATGFHPGDSGTIVVVAVLLFFLSMAVAPWLRNRRPVPLTKHEALPGRAA